MYARSTTAARHVLVHVRLAMHADRSASQDHRVCSRVRRRAAAGALRRRPAAIATASSLTSGPVDIGGNERSRAILRARGSEVISDADNDAAVCVVRVWAARTNAGDAAVEVLCDVLGLDPIGAQNRSQSAA